MKWLFYVIVFVYMFYKAVYGAKTVEHGLTVEPVTYEGDNNFLEVGEHKTISCKSFYKNQKVDWLYPNGTVVKRIPGNRVFSQEHFVQALRGRTPALVLTITKAEAQDAGVYQCRAGDQTKDVSLCVIDPSEFVDTVAEVTTDIGRSITLSCQAKGEPEPRLMWNRNRETITDEDSSAKYKVMTKYNAQGFEGLLTIISVQPEDSGIYSCVSIQENIQAEDCIHSETLNVTLNVNYAPTFEDGDEINIYAKNNEIVKLTCSAPAFPLPTYRWFKELGNDSLFEYDKKQIKFDEEENRAILSVVANMATFGQRYKCQATNDQGSSDQFFALMKMEIPSKIDEVTMVDKTDTAIQLNVTWYDEITFPVTAFEIQYIQDENKNNRKKYAKDAAWRKSKQTEVVVAEDDEVRPDLGSTMVTLKDLEEETSYWIRIRATNEAGESAWSDPICESTSTEEATTTTEASADSETDADAEAEVSDGNMNESTFYGIFFAGGIFVVSFVCMFAMRMVR